MSHRVHKAAPGTLRWHVLNEDGDFVRRCSTKREAALIVAVLDGDASKAPVLYRLWVRNAERKNLSNPVVAAILSAQLLGLKPAQVNADPSTGEPL